MKFFPKKDLASFTFALFYIIEITPGINVLVMLIVLLYAILSKKGERSKYEFGKIQDSLCYSYVRMKKNRSFDLFKTFFYIRDSRQIIFFPSARAQRSIRNHI